MLQLCVILTSTREKGLFGRYHSLRQFAKSGFLDIAFMFKVNSKREHTAFLK